MFIPSSKAEEKPHEQRSSTDCDTKAITSMGMSDWLPGIWVEYRMILTLIKPYWTSSFIGGVRDNALP